MLRPASLTFSFPNENRSFWWAALVAALIHLILAVLPWDQWFESPPPPTPVNTLTPEEMSQIRQKWRYVMLPKVEDLPDEPPKEARYESVQNRRVEQEQLANPMDAPPSSQVRGEGSSPSQKLSLGQLGVPLQVEGQASSYEMVIDDSVTKRGAEHLLNTIESSQYGFLTRLKERLLPEVYTRFQRLMDTGSIPTGDFTSLQRVVLDQEGYLLEARVLEYSSVPELDRLIPESWRAVKRVPNPPRELLDAQGQFSWDYRFLFRVSPRYSR